MTAPVPLSTSGPAAAEPRPGTDPRDLSIGYITARNARDPRTWSGTPFYMGQALSARARQVSYIGPVEPRILPAANRIARLQRRLTGWHVVPSQTLLAARANARIIRAALARTQPDILFAPAGSTLIAALETDLPIAYTSDATVQRMIGYYGHFTDMSRSTLRQVQALEQAAIDRSDLMIYPTDWVARSAIEHYGADPAKIEILPYGANLSEEPDREAALAPRRAGPVKIIFVGVDWVRKGGDIAVAALADLRARGSDAEMTIVGCVPPPEVPRDGLTIIPFLDKNDPGQARQLSEVYTAADLLLVPTRSECYGIVFCEAAAHGVPSIANATGGVTGVIAEGVTGHTLPPEAEGRDYADLIDGIVSTPGRLETLRRSARDDFETRLNWATWGERATALFRDLVAKRG